MLHLDIFLSFVQYKYNINAEKHTSHKCPAQSRNRTLLAPVKSPLLASSTSAKVTSTLIQAMQDFASLGSFT